MENEVLIEALPQQDISEDLTDIFGAIEEDIDIDGSSEDVLEELNEVIEGDESVASEDGEEKPALTPKKPKEIIQELETENTKLKADLAKFQSQYDAEVKVVKKRLKSLQEVETKYKALIGDGIDVAQRIAGHAKDKNLNGVLKELGISGDDIVDYYKAFIPDAEAVKVKMKKEEENKIKAELSKREYELTVRKFSLETEKMLAKYEDKLPVLTSLGNKGVNQVVSHIQHLVNTKDPLVTSCASFEEALRKVLPRLEKQLMKEYEPLVRKLTPAQKAEIKQEVKEAKETVVSKKNAAPQKMNPTSTNTAKKQEVKAGNGRDVDLANEAFEKEKRVKEAERELRKLFG